MEKTQDYIRKAARVVPSQLQLRWFAMEQYAFIHFGVNTFTEREWGDGTEDPAIFNPEKLDCDQWVAAIKAAGMKGMILTAKHHDGFCLWPSAYTEHSVKNSPCGKDVVKEAAEACRRGGIRFGFYLSPWDRNSRYYGTPAYNDYYCNQLTELLTNYGEIFCVWFDNACAEGGKQTYDFPRYFELIRKYQPGAVIFNDYGPDIRWCGNEAGQARAEEWAVVPTDLCHFAPKQVGPGPLAGDPLDIYNDNQEIGQRQQILRADGLAFVPSEINTSIRPYWFWLESQEPKHLEELYKIYLNSVGHNACLHLNIPPTKEGLLDSRDVARLRQLGEFLRGCFGTAMESSVQQRDDETFVITCNHMDQLGFVTLREDLTQGQRIEAFTISARFPDGREQLLYTGCTVGNRQICPIRDPFREKTGPQLKGAELVLRITSARDTAQLKAITLYPEFRANAAGWGG